jgi:spore coat protein U-like protein
MRKTVLGLAAIAAFASTPALAATASNTMPVLVNVINSCTIAATPMDFGTLTGVGGVNVDSTSTVSLVCTQGAAYNVAMNLGVNAVGTQRNLVNTTDATKKIPYALYTNAARSAPWGQTSGTDTVSGTAASGPVSLTAYGRIPSTATSVPAGDYNDTVTVTVTF